MINDSIANNKPTSSAGMSRVDGRLKVTGAAKYSAEYSVPGVTYAVLVSSTIAKGSIKSIDTKQARKGSGRVGGYYPFEFAKGAGLLSGSRETHAG